MAAKTKKCKHYTRTWYRGSTLEKPIEMWRCDNCLVEGQLDAMEEEIEKVRKKNADGKDRPRQRLC